MSSTVLEFTLKAVDEASDKFEKVAKSSETLGARMQKGLAVGTGAVLALDAVVAAVGWKMIKAGEDASTANARIKQIADSMGIFGGKTGEVTDRLVTLAEKTAMNTGIDVDAIKQTQAKLLTFKELAGSADTVGGAFDRATQAAIDMQAAGFGDAAMNAVQLGKALNDPITGLTALNRSGITFTETEKKQITQMVKSGDMHKAQATILNAIEHQVKGVAEATANGSDKMAQGWKSVEESIGTALLPTFNKFVDFLNQNVFPTVKALGEWMSANPQLIQILAVALTALTVGLVIATAAVWAMNIGLFASPITWIIVGIMALIAVVILLVANWDAVVKWLKDVWDGFVGWFIGIMKGLLDWWNGLWDGFFGFISDIWNNIVNFVTAYLKALHLVITRVVTGISDVWNNVWNGVLGVVKTVWNAVVDFIQGGINGVVDLINGMIRGFNVVGNLIGIHVEFLPHVALPHLNAGALVTGSRAGTPIVAGDGGRTEIVTDKSQMAGFIRDAMRDSGGGQMDLSERTIDKLAQAVAGRTRQMDRMGAVVA